MVELGSHVKPDYNMMLMRLRSGVRILKGCQQCRGDIYLDRDVWGAYFACMQAGHTTEADTPRGKELTLLAYRNQALRKVV